MEKSGEKNIFTTSYLRLYYSPGINLHFTKLKSGGEERRMDLSKEIHLHGSQNIKEKLKSRGVTAVKCRRAGKS